MSTKQVRAQCALSHPQCHPESAEASPASPALHQSADSRMTWARAFLMHTLAPANRLKAK